MTEERKRERERAIGLSQAATTATQGGAEREKGKGETIGELLKLSWTKMRLSLLLAKLANPPQQLPIF